MSTLLRVIGFFLILCGLIGGIILIREIDWFSYRMAKISSSTNPLGWTIIKNSVSTQLSLGIVVIVSGIISGVFFCSVGTIIDLLRELVDGNKNNEQSRQIAPSTNSIEQAAES